MDTAYICLIIVAVLMAGLCLFILALNITEKILNKKINIKIIFYEFDKKIWMIAGLGPLFLGLYLLIVYLLTFTENMTRINIFLLLYNFPVESIYVGLSIFVLTTIAIYCTRLIIKYVYNSKH